jgi:hypothetical protein
MGDSALDRVVLLHGHALRPGNFPWRDKADPYVTPTGRECYMGEQASQDCRAMVVSHDHGWCPLNPLVGGELYSPGPDQRCGRADIFAQLDSSGGAASNMRCSARRALHVADHVGRTCTSGPIGSVGAVSWGTCYALRLGSGVRPELCPTCAR